MDIVTQRVIHQINSFLNFKHIVRLGYRGGYTKSTHIPQLPNTYMDVSTDGYRYPKGNTPNQLIPQLSNI